MLLLLSACLLDVEGYRLALQAIADADGDGYSPVGGDCDDEDAAVHPGAEERCDGIDDDCDGEVDDGPVDGSWYPDADGDGFGDPAGVEYSCGELEGFVASGTDCDDADAAVNPAAAERCDAADVDEDCDGAADNGDDSAVGRSTWYADDDGDGHGSAVASVERCDQPAGYAATADDCDDGAESVHPEADEHCDDVDEDCDGAIDDDPIDGTAWFADVDVDGYGDPADYVLSCSDLADRVTDGQDCDDADAAVHPEAQEVCDDAERDEDCDTFTDDGDPSAVGQSLWYEDGDGDGHGHGDSYEIACDPPIGHGVGQDDCDDADAGRYPGAIELCDEVDADCDGTTDDPDAVDAVTWYLDLDGDGYGDPATADAGCAPPEEAVDNDLDCDDASAAAWPGAAEVCDQADNDCDGEVDEPVEVGSIWFVDTDGDGWGDSAEARLGCPEEGGVEVAGDCDDADPEVSPDGTEVCDDAGVDEDCDGWADDGDADVLGALTWYSDADGDGAGAPDASLTSCERPEGAVARGDDCDDADPARRPGQHELCNEVDDDCDGDADEDAVDGESGWVDEDGDGYGADAATSCAGGLAEVGGDCDDGDAEVNPGAGEVVDGEDNDCDGEADEGATLRYVDADGDGHGTGDAVLVDAEAEGWADVDGDCDDEDAAVNPGAAEVCENGVDDDCAGYSGCRLEGEYVDGSEDVSVTLPEGYSAWLATSTDLDGDDAEDLLVSAQDLPGNTSRVWVVPGTGFGSWNPSASWNPSGSSIYGYPFGTIGDLDSDGIVDVVVAGSSVNSAETGGFDVLAGPALYLAEGTAPLLSAISSDAGHQFARFGVDAADLDSDGSLDLAAAAGAAPDGGTGLVWFGPFGANVDEDTPDITVHATGEYAFLDRVIFCDLDADGSSDLLVVERRHSHFVERQGALFSFLGPVVGDLRTDDADSHHDGDAPGGEPQNVVCVADAASGEAVVGLGQPGAGTDQAGEYALLRDLTAAGTIGDAAASRFTGDSPFAQLGGAALVRDLDDDGAEDLTLLSSSDTDRAVVFYDPADGVHTPPDGDARWSADDPFDTLVGGPLSVDGDHISMFTGGLLRSWEMAAE